MDKWKYFDITHKQHIYCNPMNESKIQRFIGLLDLDDKRVLDIACGKGELLISLAEQYDIAGIGVDISPYCIQDCYEKKQARAPHSDLEFIEMDGADYKSPKPEYFDLASCLGASWVYGGHEGTLKTLMGMTKPGGLILVGEPYWLKEPDPEYLKADEMTKETFGTHHENIKTGEKLGLTCLYTFASDHDDWDNYETLQWLAVNNHIRANPDDPDNPELLEKLERFKEMYLRWGRDTLGWAIILFRK